MKTYISYTDQELTALLRNGDRQAYAEIYNRYKFILHNHAWNKIRDREEARDALQEVFTKLWLKRETLDIGDNLSGYLYNSVRNHILNLIARKAVQAKYIDAIKDFTEQHEVLTDHRVRENQLKELIDREIANLPPRMREVFELSRKQHLSHKEIADMLGTSEETVKKQISNSLKVLRVRLGILVYILLFIYH